MDVSTATMVADAIKDATLTVLTDCVMMGLKDVVSDAD